MTNLDSAIRGYMLFTAPLFFAAVIGLIWTYFKINRTLFLNHRDLWESLGCPGAGMWGIPRRKGMWADNKATNQFWRDKWFRLKGEAADFPPDILRLFKRVHLLVKLVLVLIVADWACSILPLVLTRSG